MTSRRRRARAAVLVLGMLASVASAGCTRDIARPPDIVLVSIDSLRADHVGAYGYERATTPRLDALAAGGVLFRNAVSTTSWTLPAHAAMFTGLYDSAHGAVDNGLRLAEGHVTLAETLRAAGYRTAGFFGGPYLHPTFGLDQGFDVYESCMSTIDEQFREDQILHGRPGVSRTSHVDITGPRTVGKIRTWLDGIDEKPFFLFVHFWDVHYDYIPPAPYAQMFDPGYTGSVTAQNFAHSAAIHAGMDERDLRHVVALYDGEIAFTDHHLGLLLDDLARRGRLENTIVVVTADHGEEFFEHGGKGHQQTLFDEVVRVPLVVHWGDRLRRGSAVEEQVRLVDLMPTLLAMAGVELPAPVSGRNVWPLLVGRAMDAKPALLELSADNRSLRAVRTLERKLVANDRSASLYDLGSDPGEQRPLGVETPAFRDARVVLDALRKDAAVLGRARRAGPSRLQGDDVDPALRERLESLGYIGGETK